MPGASSRKEGRENEKRKEREDAQPGLLTSHHIRLEAEIIPNCGDVGRRFQSMHVLRIEYGIYIQRQAEQHYCFLPSIVLMTPSLRTWLRRAVPGNQFESSISI
jgi:hypothetical protein